MLTGDNTMAEVGEVIERIEREKNEGDGQRLDALVATSLISHGVDLERINFLCMVGMPAKYAEYIQASSRAARNHVGLVMVCFKRADLRERSQFHYFMPNHKYLDRLVEAVPINRFSSFATERTVPGLLAGLLLSQYSVSLFASNRISKPFDNLRELRKAIDNGLLTRQQIETDLQEIIGVNHPEVDSLQQRSLTERLSEVLETNWDQIMRSVEQRLGDAIHPMSSFRDVDETLDFIADGAAGNFVERLRT
jgi:superfamily II DNA/RNA helicase